MWEEELHDGEVTNAKGSESSEDIGDELSIDESDFDNDMDVEVNREDLE